jgi:hypothetical protein
MRNCRLLYVLAILIAFWHWSGQRREGPGHASLEPYTRMVGNHYSARTEAPSLPPKRRYLPAEQEGNTHALHHTSNSQRGFLSEPLNIQLSLL